MASNRRHARNSRIYIGLTSAGTAEPLQFVSKWTINQAVDTVEVTAMGDVNKIRVAGLPDFSGTFSGFYDDGTVQTYTASLDGVARKFYLYPDIVNDPAQYFFGSAFADFSLTGGVSEALAVSGTFSAASTFAKVG